ncbi:hypothetical protein BSKO_10050 [Bryopsis sp. KO-2023]|nr:hypothetical protein BSKO_10050 [Bryopsis sp. KO-2023]
MLARRVFAEGIRSFASNNSLLCDTTSYLKNLRTGAEVFLVGTAHISKKSADEVHDAINFIKPDTVMVELCPERAAKLRQGGSVEHPMGPLPDVMGKLQGLTKTFGPTFGVREKEAASSIGDFIKGFYNYLRALGLTPGLEFKVAMEEAEKLGANVVYGDIDGSITMKKMSNSMSFAKFLTSLQFSESPDIEMDVFDDINDLEKMVEGMKRRAVVASVQNVMERVNPKLVQALVHDRDQHMVDILLGLQGRIVAVVGLGHMDGMERRWNDAQSQLWLPKK